MTETQIFLALVVMLTVGVVLKVRQRTKKEDAKKINDDTFTF